MLNLLFITDSPKGEYIKGVLQPVLKVIIDVVSDFDHGLKDVFEKRPATVCIQEQIGSVAGESVARHIQMLLGAGAPTFILLHEGNSKAREIKGLFEHLINMSQANEAVAKDTLRTLKSLLGSQWDKIYIPPEAQSASSRSSKSASQGFAGRSTDDVISGIEISGFPIIDGQPSPFATASDATLESESILRMAELDRAQSINDDLAEMLLMEANKKLEDESSATASAAGVDAESEVVPIDLPKPATDAVKPPPAVSETAAPVEASSTITPLNKPAVPASGINETPNVKPPVIQAQMPQAPATPPPAAEFRISQHPFPDEEPHLPGDLLLAFEENYRSESPFLRRSAVIALVCVLSAFGGWYLVKQPSEFISSLKRRIMPQLTAKPVPVAVPAPNPPPRLVPPLVQPAVVPSLPAFIPKDGHDAAYAVKNPGWERYVGTRAEFRVFTASGHIQAVQVLALKDAPISESLIKSILQEFTGNPNYQIISRSNKAGVHVENGRIQNKGEVMIYRNNGTIKAFVVSVN